MALNCFLYLCIFFTGVCAVAQQWGAASLYRSEISNMTLTTDITKGQRYKWKQKSKLKYQAMHQGERSTGDLLANIDFRFCYNLICIQLGRSILSATKVPFSAVDRNISSDHFVLEDWLLYNNMKQSHGYHVSSLHYSSQWLRTFVCGTLNQHQSLLLWMPQCH